MREACERLPSRSRGAIALSSSQSERNGFWTFGEAEIQAADDCVQAEFYA
ncbi:MAG: hypothetical protein ABEJ82_02045 [Haloplanus sp.]